VDAQQVPVTHHDVVSVGGQIAGFATLNQPVISAVFDDGTDTWTLTTDDNQTHHARIVIAHQSPFVPWIPNLRGRNDFRGTSFHSAVPEPDFDATARSIAVIGADASAGQLTGRLTASAASVKVFPLPPRRVVAPARRPRRYLRRQAEVVPSPVEAVTTTGIRCRDGARHDADAIIYGTGFTIPDSIDDETLVGARGLTIRQVWRDGMEPYLGVAVHGFPNYFMVGGSESEAALRYVLECLAHLTRTASTRIEVRRSTQQMFNERVYLRRASRRFAASAFDLSSSNDMRDDIYDGAASLTVADTCRQVRVRLIGHVDPIDGQYHWQGTVFDQLPADLLTRARAVTLTVGAHSASARITEETSQGTHSVAGVGAPPFALPDVELSSRHA
jgi:cation diffusion facilitator CzcD-associated flavoprotein CzcO